MLITPKVLLRSGAGLIMAAAVYYALACFGMSLFTLQPSNISILWLPAGIGLLMCLRWGVAAIPFIFAAAFASNLPGMLTDTSLGPAVLHTAISASADAGESYLAMLLLRRYLPANLSKTQDLLPFVIWVCLLPAFVAAMIISLNLLAGGYITSHEFDGLLANLLLANSLGIMLVYMIYSSMHSMINVSASELIRTMYTMFILAFILVAGFLYHPAIVFLVLPVLVVLSFEASLITVAIITMLTVTAIITGTAMQTGPFVDQVLHTSAMQLGAFCFSVTLTIFGIALQRNQIAHAYASQAAWKTAAEHDAMTDLYNRRGFMPRLEAEHNRALRTDRPYCLAIWDIDDFKLINDTYGHDYGDVVIKTLAQLIQHNRREIDVCARIGGEEFAMLLPECDATSGLQAMERLRQYVAEHVFVSPTGQSFTVTISIGVVGFHPAVDSEMSMISLADRALYQAKSAGKNCVRVIDPVANEISDD